MKASVLAERSYTLVADQRAKTAARGQTFTTVPNVPTCAVPSLTVPIPILAPQSSVPSSPNFLQLLIISIDKIEKYGKIQSHCPRVSALSSFHQNLQ